MKVSTARRIIKESKKGKQHPQELVDRAHQVAHEYHDKVAKEKEVIDRMGELAREEATKQGRLPEMIEAAVRRAREGAAKGLKEVRQADYRPKEQMLHEPTNGRDEKGNVVPAKRDPRFSTLAHSAGLQPATAPFEPSEIKSKVNHALRGKVEDAGFKVIDVVDAPGIEGEVLLIERAKELK